MMVATAWAAAWIWCSPFLARQGRSALYGIRISGSDVHPKKWVTELNTDERTHAMALAVSE